MPIDEICEDASQTKTSDSFGAIFQSQNPTYLTLKLAHLDLKVEGANDEPDLSDEENLKDLGARLEEVE